MKESMEVEIDLLKILESIKDKDRATCVKTIIENIREEGIIGEIRAIVNDKSYDD